LRTPKSERYRNDLGVRKPGAISPDF
jgi:hypothetical protein